MNFQVKDFHSQIDKYLKNSKLYYDTSLEHYQHDNFPKASECMWGAIAETLKAMSIKVYQQPLSSHQDIRSFLKRLVVQFNNIGITQELKMAADRLHTYFYETDLDDDEFKLMYSRGKELYGHLQFILSK